MDKAQNDTSLSKSRRKPIFGPDIFIIAVLPIASVLGYRISIIHGVTAFRLLVIFLFVYLLVTKNFQYRRSLFQNSLLILSSIFVAIIVFFAIQRTLSRDGLSEVAFILTGLALCAIFAFAKNTFQYLAAFALGWQVALAVALLAGLAERIWGIELSGFSPADYASFEQGNREGSSLFGNPNSYALFLMASLPVIYFTLSIRDLGPRLGPITRVVGASFYAILPWFIFSTQSRLAIVGATTIYFAILLASWRQLRLRIPLLLGTAQVLVFAYLSWFSSDNLFNSVVDSLNSYGGRQLTPNHGASEPSGNVSVVAGDASTNLRLELIRVGVEILRRNNYQGSGPASFENLASQIRPGLNLYNPHNGVIEITSQYGLIMIFPLLLIVVAMLKQIFSSFFKPYTIPTQPKLAFTALITFYVCLIGIFLPSSYIQDTEVGISGVFLVLVIAAIDQTRNSKFSSLNLKTGC